MDIIEKYEEELTTLQEELVEEDCSSERYKTLIARIGEIQKLLNLETSRSILLRKAETEEIRVDYEQQKLEIDRETLEAEKEKIKVEKRKPCWGIVTAIVTAVAGAGVFLFELFGSIQANNSGEVLPQALTKRIGQKRF